MFGGVSEGWEVIIMIGLVAVISDGRVLFFFPFFFIFLGSEGGDSIVRTDGKVRLVVQGVC